LSIEENKKVVRRYFDHFEKQEVELALDLLSDELEWWILGKPELYPYGGVKTKPEIAEIFGTLKALLPDWVEITLHQMIAEDDRVAVEWESRGVAANGKAYNNNFSFFFVVRDGKIKTVREYFDLMHVVDVFAP
jgi:uncharacterized protein